MIKWFKSAVILWLLCLSNGVFANVFPPVPNPFQYVNDYTHTLSAKEKGFLEQKLAAYGQKTSSQIAVVIVSTVGEYDISQYAFELGDKWGVGRKQLDNGVLMLIAKQDRKMFIAVGQGVEGVLPDAFLSQLIRQQITPHFKQGQYAQGINAGLDYLIAASQGEFDPNQVASEYDWESYLPFVFVIIFILFVLFGNRRVSYVSSTGYGMGHRSGTYSSHDHFRSGGGFGGGSRGGFGGGSFGGGGAGGSW